LRSICYADKFFSKNGNQGGAAKSVADITRGLVRCGPDKVERFQAWNRLFD
jgi:hypothetical protein